MWMPSITSGRVMTRMSLLPLRSWLWFLYLRAGEGQRQGARAGE
jgi:hypothetical protein